MSSADGAAVRKEHRIEPCGRRTAIAHSRLAMREFRLNASRERRHGLQVMTFAQLAARLAGGFSRPIDDDALRKAIGSVLPDTELGELDGIKALPRHGVRQVLATGDA